MSAQAHESLMAWISMHGTEASAVTVSAQKPSRMGEPPRWHPDWPGEPWWRDGSGKGFAKPYKNLLSMPNVPSNDLAELFVAWCSIQLGSVGTSSSGVLASTAHLTKLHLQDCMLKAPGAVHKKAAALKALSALTALQDLSLQRVMRAERKYKTTKSTFPNHLLPVLQHLTSLNLDQHMSLPAIKSISTVTGLQELVLDFSTVHRKGVAVAWAVLQHLPNLTSVQFFGGPGDMQYNTLGAHMEQYGAIAAMDNIRSLRHLHIQSPKLRSLDPNHVILPASPNMETLVLIDGEYDGGVWNYRAEREILQRIGEMHKLKHLHIKASLYNTSTKYAALTASPVLEHLHLEGRLHDDIVPLLLQRDLSKLTYLYLDHIKSEHMPLLLNSCPSLKHLHFSPADFSDMPALAVLTALTNLGVYYWKERHAERLGALPQIRDLMIGFKSTSTSGQFRFVVRTLAALTQLTRLSLYQPDESVGYAFGSGWDTHYYAKKIPLVLTNQAAPGTSPDVCAQLCALHQLQPTAPQLPRDEMDI